MSLPLPLPSSSTPNEDHNATTAPATPRHEGEGSEVLALLEKLRTSREQRLDSTIVAFGNCIDQDEHLRRLCESMFAEGRRLVHQGRAHRAYLEIDSLSTLLQLFNTILETAPEWHDPDHPNSLNGLPFNLVMMVLMETPSGLHFFQDTQVNHHLKAILARWAAFLETSASVYVLNSQTGWFSPAAMRKLESVANTPTGDNRRFAEIFECPDEANTDTFGFPSWDAFFCRRFKPSVRPRPSAQEIQNQDGAPILNACESKVFRIARNCSLQDQFWLKGQPYSIADMLGHGDLASHFVHGTIYQAYLSAMSYHRWHAPVSGTVRSVRVVDGAYFAQLPMSDMLAMEKSQSYLAAVASRAVIFIESPDSRIGLVAVVAVGMGEVSSCAPSVTDGDVVQAGDEIGCFHYGGSTHCLVFGSHVDLRLRGRGESPSMINAVGFDFAGSNVSWNHGRIATVGL
ncbi:putative phosphatidylserine decarboxylase [Aspergillus egyptiacus]|nr:putative phosphatidylserine decarboxylase [Aspergillus egyptiacus]